MELAAWVGLGLLVAGGAMMLFGAVVHLIVRPVIASMWLMVIGSWLLAWGMLLLGGLMLTDLYGWGFSLATVVTIAASGVLGFWLLNREKEEK